MMIIDTFEDVIEPDQHKQSKGLREAACARMLNHRNDPQFMAFKFWNNGVPQSLVPMVPHCSEFVTVCMGRFVPHPPSI